MNKYALSKHVKDHEGKAMRIYQEEVIQAGHWGEEGGNVPSDF